MISSTDNEVNGILYGSEIFLPETQIQVIKRKKHQTYPIQGHSTKGLTVLFKLQGPQDQETITPRT
jgi:hypothetical protein